MKVNVISESAFTAQGHGVHTAFTETVDAIREYTDWEVEANSRGAADVIHIHTIGPYALSKLLFASGAKVVSAHVTPDSFVGSLKGAKYWYAFARLYLRWFYNRADCVLAVSEEVQQELKRMGVTVRTELVPNMIRTDMFASSRAKRRAARSRLQIPAEAFVVLGSGQVQPRKRVDTFLDSARRLSKLRFIWAGGIPFKHLAADYADMKAVIEHPPANVSFSGVVSREDIVDYFQAADVFFLPSAQETFGIVIVEAAAAGLPIVLRDLEQYRQTFSPGYLAGDDDTFARIIERLASDGEYYAEWRAAAAVIAERYGSQPGARHLASVYTSLVKSKK